MHMERWLAALLIGLAACRTSPGAPPSKFEGTHPGVHVQSALKDGRLVLTFEDLVVDRFGVWIEDGAGARVEPLTVLDVGGNEVDLEQAQAVSVASVQFPLARLEARPWTLRVLPRARAAWRVLLADVRRESVEGASGLFGYQREEWAYPDGARGVSYARVRPDGQRVTVEAGVFEDEIRPTIELTSSSIPETVQRTIAACPDLADFIARGFEGGARYMGPAEGENNHPHARGERFWSRPALCGPGTRHPGAEDPVDTLVWYLVELSNASAAGAYRRIWARVLDGSLSETQYMDQETLQKAAHVRRAVDEIRANAACLGLAGLRTDGGLVFTEYEQWVRSSRRDQRALARIILRNPARYTDNPAEVGLTYAQRLQGLYREHAPIPGGRRGWRNGG